MSVYTLTRFYDNGKTEGKIIMGCAFDPAQHRTIDTDKYDQYLDEHDSVEDAQQFLAELKQC